MMSYKRSRSNNDSSITGWAENLVSAIDSSSDLPEIFTLQDAYDKLTDHMSSLYPDNKNILPKIRQQLSVLCNKGCLKRCREEPLVLSEGSGDSSEGSGDSSEGSGAEEHQDIFVEEFQQRQTIVPQPPPLSMDMTFNSMEIKDVEISVPLPAPVDLTFNSMEIEDAEILSVLYSSMTHMSPSIFDYLPSLEDHFI
jgi:Dam-replacing HTH domain